MRRKLLCMALALAVLLSGMDLNAMAADNRSKNLQTNVADTEVYAAESQKSETGAEGLASEEQVPGQGTEESATAGKTPEEGSDTGNKTLEEGTEGSGIEDQTPEEGTEGSDTETEIPEEETEGSDTEGQVPEGDTDGSDTENKDSEEGTEDTGTEDKDSAQDAENEDSEEEKTGTEDEETDPVLENPEGARQNLSGYGLADHEVADKFARGSGTQEDPYLIGTIEELNLFSQEASKSSSRYYKLSSSIRLNDNLEAPTSSWTPIENFKGHLDGNSHSIENLYIHLDSVDINLYRQDIGLFSYASSSASISNLTVENARFELDVQEMAGSSASLDMGVLVGESYASIDNCAVSGTVTITKLSSIQGMSITSMGGIVGLNGSTGTISNSTLKAALECKGEINTNYANTGIGGIAGNNRGTLEYCGNSGQIMMEQGGAAGIAYYMYDQSSVIQSCHNETGASVTSMTGDAAGITVRGRGEIANCRNEGTVKAAGEKQTAAGIAGSFSSGILSECINEGILEGTGKLAGIAGNIMQSGTDDITLTGCENHADLAAQGTTWNGYVGGIAGDISCSGTGTVRISSCTNTGRLTGSLIGGIVESIKNKQAVVQIAECHNEGVIEAVESAAGIVREVNYASEHQGSTAISNCYNLGEITVSEGHGSYTGGIAAKTDHAVIEKCYNAGRIHSGASAAGIVDSLGFYGDAMSSRVTGCFNLGEIAAARAGAGIVADLNGGTVSACYNMGRVISSVGADSSQSGQPVGGIVGECSLSQTVNSGEAVIENCFNCGVIAVENEQADYAGGIAGDIFVSGEGTSLTLKNCYNVGKLEQNAAKKGYYGAIAGRATEYDQGKIQVQKLYYSEDGMPAVGYTYEYQLPDTAARTLDRMTQTDTYEGWDFAEIWKKGNRKYQFPILRGVGESYLIYNYAGIGQDTAFGEYLLQAADQDSGTGISGAVFSYQDRTVKADRNGRIRILAADSALGMVSVTRSGYHDKAEEVTLKYGEANTIQMEHKKEIKVPGMSVNAKPPVEAGETSVNGDTANALDIKEFPIKINLKFEKKTDEEEGDYGGGFKDSIPVKIQWENGEEGEKKTKVKILFGSKTQKTKYDDYEYYKSLLEKWKGQQSENVLKEMKNMDTRKIAGKFGAESVSVYIFGYVTIDFASGTPNLVESGMVIGAEGEGSVTYRPLWAGTVAYGEFRLAVEGSGDFNLSFDEELGAFDFVSTVGVKISGTICVGIGYDLAKGEVGATGTFEGSVNIKKNWKLEEDLALKAQLVPYAMLKVGFFNITTSYEGWNVNIWPPEQVSSLTAQKTEGASYYISDRNYLTETRQRRVPFADSGTETDVLKSLDIDNVYPEGDPQICSTTEGTRVAVWIADDGSKASADRTTLYYAVIKDGVITCSGAVCETGRGDYSPTLLAKGNSVYLAWLNADRQYGDSTTLEEFCSHLSLYISVFNGSGFEEPVRVTEEGNHLPLLADLCSDGDGVTVTWVENSADNAFLAEGTNTVYSRQYKAGSLGSRQTLSEQLPYLYGLDSGYVNGSYAALWSQDTDGDLTTGEDADIYCYQAGTVSRLTDNGLEDSYVQFLGEDLYWCSGGVIRKMEQLDAASSESLGILCKDAFQVMHGEAGKAIIWMENDGFATIPMVSYEKGGVFTKAVPLTDFSHTDSNISGYSAVYEDDGSVSLFCNERRVLDQWTDSPYGQTNMRYTKGLIPADLMVDDFLYYDAMSTAPGESLYFRTEVVNHTGTQIDTLHLALLSGEKILKEEDRPVDLPVGGTAAVEMEYVLPQDFAQGAYTLTVTGVGVEENNLSNNSASVQVGYGNVALQDCSIAVQEDDTAVISGRAVNDGYQAVSGKALYVKEGGQSGEIIGQIENISLAAGESLPFSLSVGQEYTNFTHVYDVKYFYLSVEGDGMEINYADNSEILLLSPVRAQSVEAEADFQMTPGTSRTLAVSVVPQNAYGGFIFTSSDLSVAAVNQEGVITAYGIGQTDISVITEDGLAADTCKVTVMKDNGTADDGIEYSMSESVLSLDAGKEEVLYVYADGQDGAAVEPVTLTWQSSDESIVSVTAENIVASGDNGQGETAEAGIETKGSGNAEGAVAACKVKALQEGSAVVTGVSETGGAVFCIVTVKDQRIKAVSFTQAEYELQKGQTQQLSWTSRPEGAQASDFTFRSSDETVVTVDSMGQVSALAQGSATVEMVYQGSGAGQEQPEQGAETIPEVRAVCLIEVTDPALTVYSVTFDTNGGSNLADYIAFQTGEAGHVFIFPETPARPGYFFSEWNDKQDGTGTSYGSDGTLTAGTDVSADLTLYAVWIPLRDGMWAADIPDQVYTGAKLLPKVTVYDGTRILLEGQDYTLSYKNNVKVAQADGTKAPAVIVKGKGNYTGSQTVNFTILPRDIGTDEGIEAPELLLKANSKVQKPVPTLTWNGKKLANKRDFTVEYPDLTDHAGAYKEPGEYRILVKGKGNYTGERTVQFTITGNNLINKASVKGIKNKPYTGQAVEQNFTVKYGKQELTEGVDYVADYENNTEIGTASLTITGIGSYSGVKKVNFKITGGNIKKAKVTGVPNAMVYTGNELTIADPSWGEAPKLVMTVNKEDKILNEGTDYTVSYQKNTSVGTASILFTGINGYSGIYKKNFKIIPYDIALDENGKMEIRLENSGQIPYSKGGSRPEPVVMYEGQLLTAGRDYTLSYRNHTKISAAEQSKQPSVTIKGKGNFKGAVSRSFTIVQQDFGILSVTVPDKVYQNKKNAYKSTPKIVDVNGAALKAGTDYEAKYIYSYKDDIQLADGSVRHAGEEVNKDDILPAGTVIEITVDGKGNYSGQLKGGYRIVQSDIGRAKVTVPAQIYTGKEIKPGVDDIVVKVGKTTLEEGDYEITGYHNNVKKGKASITIKGTGNYGGTKTVKFTIKARSILWWWMK